MTAISFPRFPHASGWTVAEREVLLTICDVAPDDWSWEAGVTESGDPQLYLLGPHPEQIANCASPEPVADTSSKTAQDGYWPNIATSTS